MTVSELVNKVGFKVNNNDIQKVNSSISSIKSTATKLLGAIGIGFSLKELNRVAEEYDQINDRLTYVLDNEKDFHDVSQKVLESANNSKTTYGDMVKSVAALKTANKDVFPLDDAAKFVEYVTKLGKGAGYSDGEISSMQNSILRVVSTGELTKGLIARIGRQTPALIAQICDGLGVTREQFDQMADAGQITADTIKKAIFNSTAAIDKSFSGLNFGVSDAITNIKNQFGYFVDETNKMFGITKTIGRGMVSAFEKVMKVVTKLRDAVVKLSNKLGGVKNLLKLVATAAGSIWIGLNYAKILSFLKTVGTHLKSISLKSIAVSLGVLAVALIVEDLISFMQGKDSVLGEIFKNCGIDCDDARQKIKKFLETAGQVVGGTVHDIGQHLHDCWEGAKGLWKEIKKSAKKTWDKVTKYFSDTWSAIKDTAQAGWDGICEIVSDTVENVQEDWESLKKSASTTLKNIKTTVYESFEKIKNKTTEVWNNVSSKIKTKTQEIYNSAKEKFESVKKVVQDSWNKVKNNTNETWNNVSSKVTAKSEEILNSAKTKIDFVKKTVQNDWEEVKKKTSETWQTVSGKVSAKAEEIRLSVSGKFSEIQNSVSETWSNLYASVSGKVSSIKQSIITGFQEAINWIKGLPSQAVQWGRDIIESIANGITGAVKKVTDAVSGVGKKIKEFLGFSEPEKGPLSDFHTYMPDMIDLMSKGINDGRSKIKASLGNLTEDMSIMLNANMVGTGTTSTLAGTSNISKNVIQNVNISNEFNGDKAIQKSSARAMDNSADDVVTRLAHALSYA